MIKSINSKIENIRFMRDGNTKYVLTYYNIHKEKEISLEIHTAISEINNINCIHILKLNYNEILVDNYKAKFNKLKAYMDKINIDKYSILLKEDIPDIAEDDDIILFNNDKKIIASLVNGKLHIDHIGIYVNNNKNNNSVLHIINSYNVDIDELSDYILNEMIIYVRKIKSDIREKHAKDISNKLVSFYEYNKNKKFNFNFSNMISNFFFNNKLKYSEKDNLYYDDTYYCSKFAFYWLMNVDNLFNKEEIKYNIYPRDFNYEENNIFDFILERKMYLII